MCFLRGGQQTTATTTVGNIRTSTRPIFSYSSRWSRRRRIICRLVVECTVRVLDKPTATTTPINKNNNKLNNDLLGTSGYMTQDIHLLALASIIACLVAMDVFVKVSRPCVVVMKTLAKVTGLLGSYGGSGEEEEKEPVTANGLAGQQQ